MSFLTITLLHTIKKGLQTFVETTKLAAYQSYNYVFYLQDCPDENTIRYQTESAAIHTTGVHLT